MTPENVLITWCLVVMFLESPVLTPCQNSHWWISGYDLEEFTFSMSLYLRNSFHALKTRPSICLQLSLNTLVVVYVYETEGIKIK